MGVERGANAPEHFGITLSEARVTRRGLLAGSIGVAALAVLPRLPYSTSAFAAGLPVGTAGPLGGQAFVYGIPSPAAAPGPSLHAARPPVLQRAAAVTAAPIATELAALPVRSPDGSTLALTTVGESAGRAAVSVVLVDAASAAAVSQGTLTLRNFPEGALLLVTPTFAADSTTVALVLSISVPASRRTIRKLNPLTGELRDVATATWTSHHELAYFDRGTASFAGPFDLADAPSLARVTAIASASDLFLWSIDEAAAIHPRVAIPRLAAYPLGSGRARFSVPAVGPWPVNGEPVAVLASGDVARLAYGRQVEVYSTRTGRATEVPIPELQGESAQPGAPAMEPRGDGTVFINNPAIGRAVVADPARSFAAVSTFTYPRPAAAIGGTESKAVLSGDGRTLYVLGGSQTGGLSAYDAATAKLVASYSHGEHYTGIYQLAGGTLLAISPTSPRLVFFSPSLEPTGTADTDLHVAAVV
ncbi:MAG TPA: hypothetical protein VOB72_03150 [Candidatus Dormibacteraeota bacterium]|nr:hypothetical protein [Candidatus Dormibacteraeota bacterium]